MKTAKKLICGVAITTLALLGSAGAASAAQTSPAGHAHDVIGKAGELPVVGPVVKGLVRPH